MNVRILFFAAALAVALPVAARAQSPDANTNANGGEPGYGTLIASLQTADQELAELQALDGLALADVQIVFVDEVAGDDSEALDHALEEKQAEATALQQFLSTSDIEIVGDENVALSFDDILGQSEAGIGDVVAVHVNGGQVVLFVLDDATEETAVEGMSG